MPPAHSPASGPSQTGGGVREAVRIAQFFATFPRIPGRLPLYEARMGRQFAGNMEQAGSANTGEKAAMSKRAAFWRKILTDLAIMTVIGVFLAVIGPFGSIQQPLAMRLITWLLFSYIGYAIYSPMAYVVDRAHAALHLPLAPLWIAAALIASVPMTTVIYFVQHLPRMPNMPGLEEALTSYFYVFVIGGGVTLLFNVLGAGAFADKDAPEPEPEQSAKAPVLEEPPVVQAEPQEELEPDAAQASVSQAAPEPSNPLLDQLPPELGSEVTALEMEDHYVRVHTMLGSHLVLMRLRDAMAHVAELEGRQVHRSWWVARLAVEDVKREGRNVRLILAGGVEAPVSRAQVSELKTAGWI